MRIRRRDKDHPETEAGEARAVLYDQEVSPPADPVTSLIGEPAPSDATPPDPAPAIHGDGPSEPAVAPPPSDDTATPPQAEPAHAVHAAEEPPAPPVTESSPQLHEAAAPQADTLAAEAPLAVPAEAAPVSPPAAPVTPEPAEAPPSAPVRSSTPAPKHAMRTPSIGNEATDLLNGSKPVTRDLPRIIAIANQKGGVGKTTTTVNLGAALAELDYRVLVIDLDPQGNATTGLGVEARNFELSMYDVIMRDQPLEDCIEPTSVKNLFVAPATIDLAGVEIELVPAFSREMKLKRAIDTVVDDFDFVLIDCPPSLGLITVNGLAAADEVLVPIQCEYYALEGLSQLLRNVNLVSTNLNQTLEVSTIVLTMFDARTRLSVDVANEVREHFSERVCRAVIPRTVRLSEAPSFGQPITVFDPTSRGAVAYRELAKEVSNGATQRSR